MAILYVLIQVVTAGTFPQLTESETPLADAAALFLGPLGGTLVAIGGLLAIAGGNAGTMLAGPRVTYAMAAKNQLPDLFARIHSRYRTPTSSIAVYAVVSLVLAVTGGFVQLAALSAVARLIFYTTTCLSILVFRRRISESSGLIKSFWLPIAGALSSGTMILAADSISLTAAGAALLAGALVYRVQTSFSNHQRTN